MSTFDLERRRQQPAAPEPVDHSGKRIVYPVDDGLAVVVPAPGVEMDEVLAAVPDGVEHVVVDAADVPDDRTFRAAWRVAQGRLEVDMGRARDIWRDSIRQRRKGLLEALDVEAVRADEDGHAEAKSKVVARKKRLRDAPADPRIEDAQTPEELVAVDPLA